MKIKNIRNVLVRNVTVVGQPLSFNYDINSVNFVPDEVIVRSAGLSMQNNGTMYYINSPLVPNNFLCSTQDNAISLRDSNITHKLGTPIQGRFRFDVLYIDGLDYGAVGSHCDFQMVLEFVEYEKDK